MEKSITAISDVRGKDIGFLRGLIIGIISLGLSFTALFGKPAPLAVPLMCGLSGFECLFAFAGAAAGLILSVSFGASIPYIIAMIAITALKFLIGERRSGLTNMVYTLVSGVSVLVSNIITSDEIHDIFVSVIFAVISSVAAYCTLRVAQGLENIREEIEKDGFILAVSLLFMLLTASLTNINIAVFNAGIFLSSLAVLYISDSGVSGKTAVCGILSAAAASLGNPAFALPSVVISVSAPVIIFFQRCGKITRGCAFIFTVGLGMFLTGVTEESAVTAASAAAAGIVYMTVPERLLPSYNNRIRNEIIKAPRPFAAFGRKLDNMGEAVESMKTAVMKTAEALDSESTKDISWVYTSASDDVCGSCRNNMYCWGTKYNDTADTMNKAVAIMKNGSFMDERTLEGIMREDCDNRQELAAALNKRYMMYCTAENSSRKVREMRSVLTSQLSATEMMLKRMGEELSENEIFDIKLSEKAEVVLKDFGISDATATALTVNGRLTIDAYGESEEEIDLERLADTLSFNLRKEFDLPQISENKNKLHITISERAMYNAHIKAYQRNKAGNKQNGDTWDCFNDGNGNIYMIISDGMGSGSRARIDSTFACSMLSRLLKAGVDMEASLEMINTSLMVKSGDESFATLDVCRINLSSGDVLLYKAGGSSTFIRCGGKFAEVRGVGLPLGVNYHADYGGKMFTVASGDIVLMTSDGAEINKEWLEQLMLRDKNPDLDKIVETIGEALRLNHREEDDDITVLGVKITK